jgi:hypothetical protein
MGVQGASKCRAIVFLSLLWAWGKCWYWWGLPATGLSIELVLDGLPMTTHNNGVFFVGSRTCWCDLLHLKGEGVRAHHGLCLQWLGWGGGGSGAVSHKDILSIKLSHLTYMLLNMHFDIA